MQCVCLSLYSFEGRKPKWWAFTQMGLAPEQLDRIEGLQFSKMMGTGAGEGFRPWPDTGTYALLTVWRNKELANEAFSNAEVLVDLEEKSSLISSYWLRPIRGHGEWNGAQPFEINKSLVASPESKVAVITRASIKKRWMLYFWLRVRKVSRHLKKMPDLEMAKGIGEWPLIEQATFSIWKNAKAIDNYAYKGERHRKVVKATRKTGWYSEEMFMRFEVLKEQVGRPETTV